MDNAKDKFFTDLYMAHSEDLVWYAYRKVGDIELAKDLVHKTFSLLLVKLESILAHPNPAGWLHITLKYVCFQEVNKKSYSNEIPINEEIAITSLFMQDQESKESLLEILPAEFPESDKQILMWRFGEQLTYYEIANRLGITEVACRKKISRVIHNCRKFFEKFKI